MNLSVSHHRFRLGVAIAALMLPALVGLSVSAAYAAGGSSGAAGHMAGNATECSIGGIPVVAGTSDACGEWLWTGGSDVGGLAAGTYRASFQDVSGYASHIAGRVTERKSGDSIPGLSVNVLLQDGSEWLSPALTDASGYYDIGGLAAGTYRVVFGDQSGYWARQYYNMKPALALARVLNVGDGVRKAGIDASLLKAESRPPRTTAKAPAGWRTSHARITLRAVDTGGSGVFATYYKINGGVTKTYTGPLTVSAAGATTIQYWSMDWAGNVEARHRAAFTIVRTPSSHGTPSTPCTPASVRHGKRFTTFGFIVRHRSGTSPATLQFYRYKSGRWISYKSPSARVSTVLTFSRYSDSTSVPYAGKWRVRARHKIGSHYRYSGYRSFTAS